MPHKDRRPSSSSSDSGSSSSSRSSISDGSTKEKHKAEIPLFSIDELRKRGGKTLSKDAIGTISAVKGYPGIVVREIRTDCIQDKLAETIEFKLAALSGFSHPGVVRYRQVLKDGHFVFVIMDRHDGTLEKFITKHMKNREPIPRETVLSILGQALAALVYIHDPNKVDADGNPLSGIVHRDLRPENILISKHGNRIAIAGFEFCKKTTYDGNTVTGAPAYMAPETFLSKKTSTASDIWAFGAIVYELAAMKRPNFLGEQKPEYVFVNGWKPDLSDIKDDFLRGLLEKIFVLDPTKRPTAKDLAAML